MSAAEQIYASVQSAQLRYVYFLLAMSAASIAFAVSQTNDVALSASQVPLAIAVGLWALSFFAGCRNRLFNFGALGLNAERIKVQSGQHELSGRNPIAIKIGEDFLKGEFDKLNGRSALYGRWQFWLYVYGAIFFVAWHILEMYLRTQQA